MIPLVGKCSLCNIVKTTLSFIFTAVMVTAIFGGYLSQGFESVPDFGSTEASLGILAVIATLMLWTTNLDCSNCPNPKYQNWIVFGLLVITTVLALIGMVRAHFRVEGFQAGTMEGSLSILAFVFASTYWAKEVQKICETCSCPIPGRK
jgi:hypothetical protein